METTYNEQTAINALIGVLVDVVKSGNQSPELDDFGCVDISDGNRHQPLILLDEDDVANLIPFLEDNMADEKVIAYFKNIAGAKPEQAKQG